jgi:hypothetical protein
LLVYLEIQNRALQIKRWTREKQEQKDHENSGSTIALSNAAYLMTWNNGKFYGAILPDSVVTESFHPQLVSCKSC